MSLTITRKVHFMCGQKTRKELHLGESPAPAPGKIPRVAKIMSLAIRLEQILQSGSVASYSDLARIGHVHRSRVAQIMLLLYLAPDIQEEVLFLPLTVRGPDPFPEHRLRRIGEVLDWGKQRKMWRELVGRNPPVMDRTPLS